MQARNGHRNVDARNDHRSAHARTQRRGCAVVVGIDADSVRYRLQKRVCEETLQLGRSCVTVCMCVLYNRSPMLLFWAQVGMADFIFWDAGGFGYTIWCYENEADVIRGSPRVVYPRCLRCICDNCSINAAAILRDFRGEMDYWRERYDALFGRMWRPSLSNIRALHVAVSCRMNATRTELATLCLHASLAQMRCIWHGKRVLERWFRFIAWRRRAWIRVTFVHRVTFECLTIIGAMVFAPPRRLIFRH